LNDNNDGEHLRFIDNGIGKRQAVAIARDRVRPLTDDRTVFFKVRRVCKSSYEQRLRYPPKINTGSVAETHGIFCQGVFTFHFLAPETLYLT